MTPEQFLTFADPLPEPMLLVVGDGLVLAGNRAVEKRLSIALNEVRGKNLAEIVADSPEELARYLQSCARSRSLVLGSLDLLGVDGKSIPCRSEGTLLRPRTKRAEAILLLRLLPKESAASQFVALNQRIEELGREIQRRRRAEEEAREQGNRLRVTLQSIGDGVITTDPEGRVTMMNPVAERLTGWTQDEATGLPLVTVFRIVNETSRQVVENPAMRALRAGVVVGLANHTVLIAKDGTERPIADSAAPIRHDGGPVVGSVLVFRDVTGRRRAEAAIRESEEKLRLLADTIPQLAWMARPDGHIFWYNRRWYEYTGTTPEEMEGWGWQSVHDPNVLPKVLDRWKASISSGEPFDMVFPLKGADDQFRPFLTRVNPLRDQHGRILYWFGTNTDISEIKRMEEALRDADRRKDEFLATLAHELRNPLAPIRNSLQILKLPRVDATAAQQTRDMMERQVQHLVRLVDDLLDVSRVMQGKIQLRRERVELATVVARAIETVQPQVDAQGHDLSVRMASQSLLLDADPVRIAQVIGNLLTNAVKYTESNGRIWLTADRDGDMVVLGVRDNGIGISPEMLPRIFELFVQVDHASSKAHGGLGIGLTLVKNLVEMHNGTVEARSEGLGKGSEFIVHLPVLPNEHDEDRDSQDVQQADRLLSPSGHRLLVVDDNQDAANSLAMLLKLEGHEVRVAFSGMGAVEMTKTYTPDAIFMDIGMPGMDGYEAARRIREQPGMRKVVLVALTGWGQLEDRRRTAEAGFNHHLVKPPEPKAVEDILSELKRRDLR